jgi:hypothetical protein
MYKNVMKCNFDSKDLFSKRDEDGYIILDDKISEFTKESREKMGNEDRLKNWIETTDGKQYLIKTNAMLEGEKNYTNYAELICMKLAEKMGLEYAKYDIIKINGKEGVITENILKKDEYMFTLEDMIDSSYEHPFNPDVIDYPDAMRQLGKKLTELNYDKKEAKALIDEFNKRMVFDCIVGAADRHAENISFVGNIKDNKKIKLSPIYDSENSLLLENNVELVKEMALDRKGCADAALGIIPKIGLVPNKNAQAEDIVRATFEVSISPQDEDDYELEDYASKMLEEINVKEVFDDVEKQIGALLPFEVKSVASTCISKRIDELNKVLDGREFVEYDKDYIDNVKNIINDKRNNSISKEDIQ